MFGIERWWKNANEGGRWQALIRKELMNYNYTEYDSIQISTSGTDKPFDVIDVIFCFEIAENKSDIFGFSSVIFRKISQNLRVQCKLLGGDAIINAQFEHRSSLGESFFGNVQYLEIYAYATVIKYRHKVDNYEFKETNFINQKHRDLNTDQYKIYLAKKYQPEFNALLDGYLFNNTIYKNPDTLLSALHDYDIALEKDTPTLPMNKYILNTDNPDSFLEMIYFPKEKKCWYADIGDNVLGPFTIGYALRMKHNRVDSLRFGKDGHSYKISDLREAIRSAPNDANAKCPSCDSKIFINTAACPHCDADLDAPKGWRPIPI